MSMQTDVKSAHTAATGSMVSGRCRLKGYQVISGGTAGDVIFTDGNGGATLVRIRIGTGTQPIGLPIPGEGILAHTGIYVTLPTSAEATIFYA